MQVLQKIFLKNIYHPYIGIIYIIKNSNIIIFHIFSHHYRINPFNKNILLYIKYIFIYFYSYIVYETFGKAINI